jgi:hypothetical protein
MAYDVEPINENTTTGYNLEPIDETQPLQGGVSQTQPLQGGVSQTQQPNDIWESFRSGISTIPRALANASNTFLRPILGKQPLSQQELNQGLQGIGINQYKPQTNLGNVANFAGNILPVAAVTAATGGADIPLLAGEGLLPQAVNMATTGAVQGGVMGATNEAAQGNFNPQQIAQQAGIGALTNTGIGMGLKGAGQAFEAIQPTLANLMSKIPKEDYATVLNSIKNGENPFAGNSAPLKDLIEEQKEFAATQAEQLKTQQAGLSGSSNLNNNFVNSQLNQFNNNTKNELNQFDNNAQQTTQALKDIHSQEKNDAVQVATDLAHSTANTVQQVQKQYGKAVGQQANALEDTDNIPLSEINSLIDSNIKGASQGTELNPAGDEASNLGSQLKSMLTRGALKNQGLNDAQINAYLAQKGSTVDATSSMEQVEREYLTRQGMNPSEINDRIDIMRNVGLIGQPSSVKVQEIPPVDEDNLDISQKGLHVLKQYLQSRKINYEAESNPVSGIVKNIADGFNQTLRDVNPNYAAANDQYSELAQFLNKPENSFFNNTDQMASKFANISGKAGTTSDTLNKVKQFESIAQDAGLGQGISGHLENIKSLPDVHAQQLDDLNNSLNTGRQQLLDKHAADLQNIQQNLVKQKYDFLNQQQQEKDIFNQGQALPLAMTSFNKFSPSATESTLSGFASPFTITPALMGHPQALIGHALYSGARSPLTQRAILEAYMNGRNIAPYLPSAGNILSQYMQGGQQ